MSLMRKLNTQAMPTDPFGHSIERRSVAMQLLERIKSALIRGELKPGDYLPSESELTQSLGIGKSSVRVLLHCSA